MTVMQRHKNGIKDNVENLIEDARALLAATADVASDQVAAARKRVASTIESAKDACADAQDAALAGVKATDQAIRDYPYHSIGVAFAVGVAIGLILNRRN